MTIETATATRPEPANAILGISADSRPVPLAYRVQDACYVLGIGRTSLYELVKAGELRLIKVAGRTLVPHAELERLTSVDRDA